MPGISLGPASYSQKWKQAPQHNYLKSWEPAVIAWKAGKKVVKLIGFDDSPRDRCRTYSANPKDRPKLLGHKNIKMPLRYTHLAPSHLAKAVDMLDRTMGMRTDTVTKKKGYRKTCNPLILMVGPPGIEPGTSTVSR